MLEYYKMILLKVSFNKDLFEKELKKSLTNLLPEEINTLTDWVIETFGEKYPAIIQSILRSPMIEI